VRWFWSWRKSGDAANTSGERTRLAEKFVRPTAAQSDLQKRFAIAGARLPAREARVLPNPDRRAMTPTLHLFLIVSAALFSIGLLAALSRRHAIFILIGIEMMLAAANLNFIAFWRFAPQPHQPTGVMIAIFSIAISAAEAAVGLAMVIAVYRHYRTTNVDQLDQLKG
jgi:NADH:ubiquinone oxidoreductase subunit K